jgi:hypothetical protein
MTPKERFLQRSDDVKQHASLVNNSTFINSLDVAMLEYQSELTSTGDLVTGAANFHRIEGARGFIRKFLSLSKTITIPQKTDRSNLLPT